MSFFVTGTGTEVGKTVVAAAIARTAADRGQRVAVFKPAVSGLDDLAALGREPDHELLRRAAGSQQSDDEIAPYRYGPPVSPHLGAELAGERIEPARLLDTARAAADRADVLICEGVGGLMVPLTTAATSGRLRRPTSATAGRLRRPTSATAGRLRRPPGYLVRDLARDLALPLVIAAPPGLGTINHTLLTIEAARAVALEIAAVVLSPWPGEPSDVERSNREAIAQLGSVAVETLPRIDLGDPASWPALEPA